MDEGTKKKRGNLPCFKGRGKGKKRVCFTSRKKKREKKEEGKRGGKKKKRRTGLMPKSKTFYISRKGEKGVARGEETPPFELKRKRDLKKKKNFERKITLKLPHGGGGDLLILHPGKKGEKKKKKKKNKLKGERGKKGGGGDQVFD